MVRSRPLILTVLIVSWLLVGCTATSLPGAPLPTPLPPITPPRPISSTPPPVTSAPETTASSLPELSGYVGGTVLIALDAARAGDWDKVKEELQEAVDLSVDVRERALFSSMLTQLTDGATDEVRSQLEELAGRVAAEAPLLTEMEDALRFARIGDWEEVKEEVTEALGLTSDSLLQTALQEILADLERGQREEAIHDLERLVSGVGDEDPALPTLQEALASAKQGTWDQVRTLLEQAVDQTGDDQHRAAIIEMLDDLTKNNTDEILSDLTVLIGSHVEMDPVLVELRIALTHAVRDEWDSVEEELAKAEELSTQPDQRALIASLREDLAQNRQDEVIAGLEEMLRRR